MAQQYCNARRYQDKLRHLIAVVSVKDTLLQGSTTNYTNYHDVEAYGIGSALT